MDKYITTPITEEKTAELHAGDYVYITGTIYVARDAAHKRMMEVLERGEELPIDILDSTIYYMGPSPAREGRPIGSAGPTTASRMDKYAPKLLDLGLKGMIGKGKRKSLVSMVVIACFMKIIYVGWLADKAIPDLVAKVMASAVWFCIGMLITATPFKKSKLADGIAVGMVILACILSYFVYSTPTDNAKAQFIFASIFVLVITYFFQSKEQYKIDGLVNHSAKYFMPVYVLHTIVAAGVRTVLLKIGISSGILHFMIGFSVSVFVPIVIYIIAEKQWWLLFWFEPIKAMKLRNQKK